MKLNFKIRMIILVLSLVSCLSGAQSNYLFRVFACSGSAEIKTGDSWKPLKSGANLFEQDEIRLNEKAYVSLVHINGRSTELMKAGLYKIKTIASAVPNTPGVLSKYIDFILSKNSDEARKNRLVAVGAVTRSSFKDDIIAYLPENQRSNMFNTKAVINWESKSDTPGPYILTVQNMSNQDLIIVETTEPTFTLDFNNPELSRELYYLIQVRNKNNKTLSSDQYLIKKLQKDEQQKLKDQLALLSMEMAEESALNKIVLAAFYEDNQLFIDAITVYEEAIQLTPEVEYYKEVYEEFLLRNRLKFPKQ